MENQLQIFKNQEFGELRAILRDGEPWFVAKDVCATLELNNSAQALSRLDEDERNTIILNEGIGNPQKSIVSESGLYSLALGSRKPQAKPFKRWVTHEVIPTIRKHGMYATPETAEKILGDPDFLIETLQTLKKERALRQEAEQKIEQDKPKVLFAEAVGSSKQSILIRELAKLLAQNGIQIGEKRLFSWLRANGFLISKLGDDYNLPSQYSMERKLMVIRERTYSDDVHTRILRTPMITGKGQRYFVDRFLNKERMNYAQ